MEKPVFSEKILLQLSGGKDSIACLILLADEYPALEAIHFVHEYSYDIPTKMSIMTCNKLNIKLHVVDINDEIESVFLSEGFVDRPCRYCKAIMDRITVEYAQKNKFSTICVGDTADDTMLINRIINVDGGLHKMSKYLNANVTLPSNISIYRPLIDKSSSYTLSLVISKFPDFTRTNDTGDKYFEYSREGCPLQFKDLGIQYTKELMCKLKHMNYLCSKFATQNGIKASIHLPSEQIVTIPEGFENECKRFLIENGCKLYVPNKVIKSLFSLHILIQLNIIENISTLLNLGMARFCERINVKFTNKVINDTIITIHTNSTSIFVVYNECYNLINILINSTEEGIILQDYKNICIEIFHTNRISVSKSTIL